MTTPARSIVASGMIVSLLTIKAFAAETPTPTASTTPPATPSASVAVTATALPKASVTQTPATQKQIDVSKIVRKTDAEKTLGEPVRDPQPLNSTGPDGYYSKCNYYSSKSARSLLVRVRQASPGSIDPQKEFEQVTASGGTMKAVTGLGEKAGMFNGAPQNGLPPNVIMLYVVKGNAFVTVGLSGMKDEAGALEKAKEIARKVLAKL
jgi:hypothetical protein